MFTGDLLNISLELFMLMLYLGYDSMYVLQYVK